MSVFSDIYNKVVKKGSIADEPPVDEQLGVFGDINIPVQQTKTPAYWGMSNADVPYTVAQTQEEHNRLLNTFYPQRKSVPNWKELGREVEKQDPRYSSSDSAIRKNIGAKSSVIQDIAYSPEKNLAMLKMGGNWYTYSATPKQFQQFLQSGSLGREMNNIKNNKSTSMNKTEARHTPKYNTPNAKPAKAGGLLSKLFGFLGF